MAVDAKVMEIWQEVQRESSVPVNAIGMPISPDDHRAMKFWHDQGLAVFLKKEDEPESDDTEPILE